MAGNWNSSRIAAAVAAALGLAAPVGAAFAEAVAADGTVLEEIIVTATRREVNVQDVPFNMVALGPESLEKLRINNLAEFTRAVPGLHVPDQGPRSSNLITVRGLNVSSLSDTIAIGNGTGGTVATYLGDIPLFVDLQMIDVERVEALLGPQGTLYGVGTLAGAIRYLPNRPDPAGFEATAGGRRYSINESAGMGTDGGQDALEEFRAQRPGVHRDVDVLDPQPGEGRGFIEGTRLHRIAQVDDGGDTGGLGGGEVFGGGLTGRRQPGEGQGDVGGTLD